MPQVWNPSISTDHDSGAFSKNSRFNKLANFSDASLRRIKVRNKLENKLNKLQQSYIARHSNLSTVRIEQARKNIIKRYRRYAAYKLVVQNHPIKNRRSYSEALNDNYSMHALRHEVRRMLHAIDPDVMRRRKAEDLVQKSRDVYADTVSKNRDAIVDIVPKPKPVVVLEEDNVSRSPTPPPVPPPFRRSLVGPPLRGLAHKAQAVTLKMVKEQSWMGTAPSPEKSSLTPSNSVNPQAVLPPIQTK